MGAILDKMWQDSVGAELDSVHECLDWYDAALTANTKLLEEALVRIEALERREPEVARDEAETAAERVRLILLEDEEEMPVAARRRCSGRQGRWGFAVE